MNVTLTSTAASDTVQKRANGSSSSTEVAVAVTTGQTLAVSAVSGSEAMGCDTASGSVLPSAHAALRSSSPIAAVSPSSPAATQPVIATSDAVPPPSQGVPTTATDLAAGPSVSPIATPVEMTPLGSAEALEFTPVIEETLTKALKHTLGAETGLQMFPACKTGEVLLVTVVLEDRAEYPVKLRMRPEGSFVCQAGWPAVRAAAGLKPGDSFGAIPRKLYPLNTFGLRSLRKEGKPHWA